MQGHYLLRTTILLPQRYSLCSVRIYLATAKRITVIQTSERFLYSANGPSKPSAVWERGASKVKNTDHTNPYLDLIRDTHDPSLHLKTIEDELKGTIGKALGKQGEKILYAVRLMNEQYQTYEELLEKHGSVDHPQVIKAAVVFNEYRSDAVQARWELTVHRQAAGFIVNNHKYVTEQYPIANALPIAEENGEADEQPESTSKDDKKFGDQLDWWQRIGRWK